ncbi:unnamed protein product, partial [Iphiclides podalirius]
MADGNVARSACPTQREHDAAKRGACRGLTFSIASGDVSSSAPPLQGRKYSPTSATLHARFLLRITQACWRHS